MRVRAISVAIIAGISLAACGSSPAATGSSTSSTSQTSTSSGGTGQTSTSAGGSGTPSCPNASVITGAMGSTFTGPISANNGTAGCNYSGGGNEVYVLFEAAGLPQSQFVSQSKSGLGPTAAPVSGLGESAFASTAYGHAEVDVYGSSSRVFTVSVTTANAVVQPGNLTQAEAVARAIVAG